MAFEIHCTVFRNGLASISVHKAKVNADLAIVTMVRKCKRKNRIRASCPQNIICCAPSIFYFILCVSVCVCERACVCVCLPVCSFFAPLKASRGSMLDAGVFNQVKYSRLAADNDGYIELQVATSLFRLIG